MRLPVAANTAFATAGAAIGTVCSPKPAGVSVLGTMWVSMTGAERPHRSAASLRVGRGM